MTQEEKARAYDEALEDIRVIYPNLRGDAKLAVEHAFPVLAESEDEKARKWIYDFIRNCPNESFEFYGGVGKQAVLAYLEKQKYDRMQPVYDNQESFESALDKAWKSYNDSGARTVDGCEDNYTECAYAKGFREGYLFGLQKQKDLDKMIVVSPEVWDKAISDALKDLPRWRRDDSIEAEQYITVYKNGSRFHYKGHSLLISDLTKLPGFNEDEK